MPRLTNTIGDVGARIRYICKISSYKNVSIMFRFKEVNIIIFITSMVSSFLQELPVH